MRYFRFVHTTHLLYTTDAGAYVSYSNEHAIHSHVAIYSVERNLHGMRSLALSFTLRTSSRQRAQRTDDIQISLVRLPFDARVCVRLGCFAAATFTSTISN